MPTTRSASSDAFESEIPLIIKDEAEYVRKDLAAVRHLLGYDLRSKRARTIHDTYYDTQDYSLRRRKITLRIRRLGHMMMISSKSDLRRYSGNLVQRREVELPWGYDSVRRMARTLNLKIPAKANFDALRVQVSETLAAMGLEVIQERRTHRMARDIVRRSSNPSRILAELAIDKVTYNFERIKAGLSEIEIESKAPGGLTAVREVANELLSKYQPFLQDWPHGKFVTGLAIRKLLETKKLQPYLSRGDLEPGAFRLVDRAIRSGI